MESNQGEAMARLCRCGSFDFTCVSGRVGPIVGAGITFGFSVSGTALGKEYAFEIAALRPMDVSAISSTSPIRLLAVRRVRNGFGVLSSATFVETFSTA